MVPEKRIQQATQQGGKEIWHDVLKIIKRNRGSISNFFSASPDFWQKKILSDQEKVKIFNFKSKWKKMSRQIGEKKLYHGCALRNKNGTRKLIEYEKWQNCICGTNNVYWKAFTKK